MENTSELNQYVDFKNPNNLCALIEKDENGCFPLKVIAKDKINHDSYKIVLEFPNAEWISGLWAAGHFVFHADINGKHVSRKMTPVSMCNLKGKAEFVIKIYRKCDEYPDGGKYTVHLEENVHVGDSIMISGPVGKMQYLGWGNFIFMKRQMP